MFENLIESFLLGFAISALPGAVFFETVRRALHRNAGLTSFLFGNFGGMLVVMLAAFLGLSAVRPESEIAKTFYIFSGLLLVYIGISSVLVRKGKMNTARSKYVHSSYSGFLTGFALAVANPPSIAFWVSFVARLLQETGGINSAILSSVSVILGAGLLFATLVLSVNVLRLKIKTNHLMLLSRSFGLLVIVFGVITLSKAL